MGTPSRLDAGLLICREDELVVAQRHTFPVPFVEIQDWPCLGQELAVAREDPTTMLPRADCILVKPAPYGLVAYVCDDAGAADLPRHISNAHPRQRKTATGRQLTRQSLDLNDHVWGEKPGVVRGDGDPPTPPAVRRRNVFATG